MKELQSDITLEELLQVNPQAACSNTEEDFIWLGLVPGQRLPDDFLQMDADTLRRLFIISRVPMEVWTAACQLFGDKESSAISWLCSPALGLGGLRPVDAISSNEGKTAVITLINRLIYGVGI